jgi:hypothetical protein
MIFASTYLGMAVGPFITRKIGSFNLSFSVLFALIFSATATMLIIFVNFYEKNKMGKTDNNLENASGLKN